MDDWPFSDKEYGKILDNVVVACVDVAVTYKNKILLVKRTYEPTKNEWWLFGGRVIKGENLNEAAQRGVYRELGLNITDLDRFIAVGTYNLIWPIRREPDTKNGCQHLLIAHQIELTEPERMQLVSKFGGKSNYQWFNINNFQNENFDPNLKDIINKLVPVVI